MSTQNPEQVELRRDHGRWDFQAFTFALDLTREQRLVFYRNAGARRVAFNWAVGHLQEAIAGDPTVNGPHLGSLMTRWRTEREVVAVNATSGKPWWPDVSPWALQDGIQGALNGVGRWRRSLAGEIAGKAQNFPRPRKRNKSRLRFRAPVDEVVFDADCRTISLPVLGRCRSHQNTRQVVRLLRKRRIHLVSLVLKAKGKQILAVINVRALRPQRPRHHATPSIAGVDVGIRVLATVASADGQVIRQFENPRALEGLLEEIRRQDKKLSRQQVDSRRHRLTRLKLSRLYSRAAAVRDASIHRLTHYLANNFAVVAVESLSVHEMLDSGRQGYSRSFRRSLADSSFGLIVRQLKYKCKWYGSRLTYADKYFPSSKLCSSCGYVNDIGTASTWQCMKCHSEHDRDVNAAINLARFARDRFQDSALSPP